jgi:hypothetical protein
MHTCCPIVELRQYTLHPGQRDVLIDLFEREFVESHEAVGMELIGLLRDLDRPERFVWLRGFRDMPSRADALGAFYGGPVWAAHRAAANATMIDSDDVLLLRPATPASGFPATGDRPAPASAPGCDLVVATIYHLRAPADVGFVDRFSGPVTAALRAAGTAVVASFVTEGSANTFPALPVREGESVFVWFARFPSQEAYAAQVAALDRSPGWRDAMAALRPSFAKEPELLRLSPTLRSKLRG